MFPSACRSIVLPVCPFTYLTFCQHVCNPLYLSAHLSFCSFIYLSLNWPTCKPPYLSAHWPNSLSFQPACLPTTQPASPFTYPICLQTIINTCLPIHLPKGLATCPLTNLPNYLPISLSNISSTTLPPYLLTYLPSTIRPSSACPPTNVSSYLLIPLPVYQPFKLSARPRTAPSRHCCIDYQHLTSFNQSKTRVKLEVPFT